MRSRVLISLAMSCAVLFIACAPLQTAHLVINNDSHSDVPMTLSISPVDKHSPAKNISNNLKPGLQQWAPEKLPAGSYTVSAETANGQVIASKRISLDSDRWIIINFINSDSLDIQKKYGFVDTQQLKKLNGKYSGIDIYAESRKPATLETFASQK